MAVSERKDCNAHGPLVIGVQASTITYVRCIVETALKDGAYNQKTHGKAAGMGDRDINANMDKACVFWRHPKMLSIDISQHQSRDLL